MGGQFMSIGFLAELITAYQGRDEIPIPWRNEPGNAAGNCGFTFAFVKSQPRIN